MYNIIVTILICGIISLLYIIFLKSRFTHQISMENEKTIRFYLDRQLLIKMIYRLIDAEPLQNIKNDATKYFILDESVIFKIHGNVCESKKSLSNEVCNYIQTNMDAIKEHLLHNKFFNIQKNVAQGLLIQYLSLDKKYFVIYVTSSENALVQNDIDLLTDAVTPIIHFAVENSTKNGELRNV